MILNSDRNRYSMIYPCGIGKRGWLINSFFFFSFISLAAAAAAVVCVLRDLFPSWVDTFKWLLSTLVNYYRGFYPARVESAVVKERNAGRCVSISVNFSTELHECSMYNT